MKKLLLSAALLVMISIGASAQSTWHLGPKVGFNASAVNGYEGAKPRYGFTAGVFIEKPVCQWFAVQAELMYSQSGFSKTNLVEDKDVKSKFRLDYIMMPVVTKFYVTRGLNFQLGANFGYAVTNKVKVGDKNETITGQVNRYHIGIMTGLAYDFDFGLILEGRYNLGLTDVFTSSDNRVRQGSLQFLVGWKF